jgi:hypothetical protein
LLICIANNPDVCFFVVSHYATPAIEESLKDLLSARIQSVDPDFYGPFIVNKSNLLNLGKRVLDAYSKWFVLASLIPVVEPFAGYPVYGGKKVMRFDKWIEQLSLDHLADSAPVQQAILWDESGTFEGGIERWQSIQKRWRNGLEVVQQSALSVGTNFKSVLVIEPSPLQTAPAAKEWAISMNSVFAGRAQAKRETLVVLRGTRKAYAAAANSLSGVTLYRIPAFHDKAFSKVLPTVDVIRRIAVTSDEQADEVHLQQWGDASDRGIVRSMDDVLQSLCRDPEEAVDRLAYFLEQEAKASLNAFQSLLAVAAPVLRDLRLTEGENQDWKSVFDDAGLKKPPFWGR